MQPKVSYVEPQALLDEPAAKKLKVNVVHRQKGKAEAYVMVENRYWAGLSAAKSKNYLGYVQELKQHIEAGRVCTSDEAKAWINRL